jgi:hypothetical protein
MTLKRRFAGLLTTKEGCQRTKKSRFYGVMPSGQDTIQPLRRQSCWDTTHGGAVLVQPVAGAELCNFGEHCCPTFVGADIADRGILLEAPLSTLRAAAATLNNGSP